MTKEDLRTKYERVHFEESDNKKGKLKQGYAKWLENELIEAINYSRCCTELKVEPKMNFGNWKFSKGLRYVGDHTYKDNDGDIYDADEVDKMYQHYYNL